MTRPTSIRLPPALAEQVATLAATLRRPRSWVIEQALTQYIDVQTGHIAAIEKGLADARADRVTSHENVVAWVNSWGTANPLPMPDCTPRGAADATD